jgi:hypothetical protein
MQQSYDEKIIILVDEHLNELQLYLFDEKIIKQKKIMMV